MLKITVYDKDFQRKGWLGSPEKVNATVVHNAVGSAEVTFPADHNRAADILAEGARLLIEYEGLSEPLISGPVRSRKGEGPAGQSMITVTVEDDLRVLWRVLGWPNPAAALTSQTSEYRTYTGAAETILKDMVSENVARLGLPVTVAPDQGRGGTISGGVKIRMHPLAERLFPAIEQAGIGVRCYQSGAGLVLDVYEPRTYPRTISEKAGTLRSWSWSSSAPTVTRVVGGGQGEGVNRMFRSATDTSLEVLYGDVVEGFVDSRSSETTAEIDQDNLETLIDGKPKAGLSLELSETKHFRYGPVRVGDIVTIEAGGLTVTDVLRSASFTWTRADGLTITPAVGEVTDSSETTTLRAVKKLWRGLTNLKVR